MTNRKITYKPIAPEILELAQTHGENREAMLEILTELDRRGHLNPETISDTARALGIPAHLAYGVTTFYSVLSLHPRPLTVSETGISTITPFSSLSH